jgi:hypothetical protein
VALIVAPLLWLTVSFIRNNSRQLVFSVTVLAAIKPQYGLLVVLLAAYREWKPFIYSIRAVVLTQFLGFLLWPSSFPGSVRQAFAMSQQFQSYSSISDKHPPQISLASGAFQMERIVRNILNFQTPHSNFFSIQSQTKIGYFFAAILIVFLFFKGRHSPKYLTTSILIAILSMISATTYSYYGVFAMVLSAILIRNSSLANSQDSEDASSHKVSISFDFLGWRYQVGRNFSISDPLGVDAGSSYLDDRKLYKAQSSDEYRNNHWN